ncbi:hypothetical protein OZD67_03435 [Wolbachia endosymbiont of Drosophila nikananu]|uniref:hypothetical protein n=1 Tax=Wolbachia endosymbiont of Drosophila nikananu TaxID=375550 RepID=UPI0023A9B44F|nr:hypothetical protein [Wolbachia endosymbiont of Drosophila nikananu]MDE5061166.1 hypothetical protein [Wolbachia endosymbiont of Drosophila nikananu]
MLPNGHSSTIERPVITAKILLNKLYLKIVIALDKIVSFRFNKIFPCSMLPSSLCLFASVAFSVLGQIYPQYAKSHPYLSQKKK